MIGRRHDRYGDDYFFYSARPLRTCALYALTDAQVWRSAGIRCERGFQAAAR